MKADFYLNEQEVFSFCACGIGEDGKKKKCCKKYKKKGKFCGSCPNK
jgi:hypothetical protein